MLFRSREATDNSVSAGEWVAMKAEQSRLAARVEALEAQVARLQRELGPSND